MDELPDFLTELLKANPEMLDWPASKLIEYLERESAQGRVELDAAEREAAATDEFMKIIEPYMAEHPGMTTSEAMDALRIVEGPDSDKVRRAEAYLQNHEYIKVPR